MNFSFNTLPGSTSGLSFAFRKGKNFTFNP